MGILKEHRKMLIVKPSAMGDIIHGLAFLNSVKKRLPSLEVHWVVAKGFQGIVESHPMIDKLWVIDKNSWKKPRRFPETLREMKSLGKALRREQYDIVVDLQGLLRSALICALTGARLRVGFAEAREGSPLFYTMRVRGGSEIHAVDRYLSIASALGCDNVPVEFPLPPFPEIDLAGPCFSEDYCVIAPSAGGAAKRWPAAYFGELAARLPLRSLVIAGEADSELARQVEAASGGRAVSIAGKTNLREVMAIVGRARFLVSSDTGPMHLAAALRVPVFAVFGPTNPVRTGPYGDIHTIIRAELPCAPCYKRKKCRQWLCMPSITVERVLKSIRAGMR